MASLGTPGGPINAADCHFHVVAPLHQHPMAAGRSDTPAPAPLAAWQGTLGPLGVTHGVVVQPSFYGLDNGVLLQALAQGQGRFAGVAAVAPDIADAALDALVAAGVRGVRLAHVQAGDQRAARGFVPFSAFEALEPRLARRGLHLNLLTDSRWLPDIAQRLATARVPVVIDHMGRAPAALGAHHAGLDLLCRLLDSGQVWVKLSGVANISSAAPAYADAAAVHARLLACNPQRLVWGSDWPHTRPAAERPYTAQLWRLFHDWTPLRQQQQLLLQTNPQALYGWPEVAVAASAR